MDVANVIYSTCLGGIMDHLRGIVSLRSTRILALHLITLYMINTSLNEAALTNSAIAASLSSTPRDAPGFQASSPLRSENRTPVRAKSSAAEKPVAGPKERLDRHCGNNKKRNTPIRYSPRHHLERPSALCSSEDENDVPTYAESRRKRKNRRKREKTQGFADDRESTHRSRGRLPRKESSLEDCPRHSHTPATVATASENKKHVRETSKKKGVEKNQRAPGEVHSTRGIAIPSGFASVDSTSVSEPILSFKDLFEDHSKGASLDKLQTLTAGDLNASAMGHDRKGNAATQAQDLQRLRLTNSPGHPASTNPRSSFSKVAESKRRKSKSKKNTTQQQSPDTRFVAFQRKAVDVYPSLKGALPSAVRISGRIDVAPTHDDERNEVPTLPDSTEDSLSLMDGFRSAAGLGFNGSLRESRYRYRAINRVATSQVCRGPNVGPLQSLPRLAKYYYHKAHRLCPHAGGTNVMMSWMPQYVQPITNSAPSLSISRGTRPALANLHYNVARYPPGMSEIPRGPADLYNVASAASLHKQGTFSRVSASPLPWHTSVGRPTQQSSLVTRFCEGAVRPSPFTDRYFAAPGRSQYGRRTHDRGYLLPLLQRTTVGLRVPVSQLPGDSYSPAASRGTLVTHLAEPAYGVRYFNGYSSVPFFRKPIEVSTMKANMNGSSQKGPLLHPFLYSLRHRSGDSEERLNGGTVVRYLPLLSYHSSDDSVFED